MWIGADDGLALWRAGQTRIVRLPPADRPAEVANFYQDAQGTLWMATKGEGIRRARADGDGIATIGAAHGLPTGWIVQLLEDGRGGCGPAAARASSGSASASWRRWPRAGGSA
jgi:ligand-binding sensor domain-containing protein